MTLARNGDPVVDQDGGFSIEDDGPGIPADARDQAFESGYSTTTEGTGFGLANVKEIVEAHGWEISVAERDRWGSLRNHWGGGRR